MGAHDGQSNQYVGPLKPAKAEEKPKAEKADKKTKEKEGA